MGKKDVMISISKEVLDILQKRGKNRSKQIETYVYYYVYLEEYTYEELKGIFTYNELLLIADALNGWIYYPPPAPLFSLYVEVEDAINLDKLDAKYNVNKEVILGKIKNLTNFQAHVLIVSILKAWDAGNIMKVIEELKIKEEKGEVIQ